MYGVKECSSCGSLYNREQCCSNVSFVENFVRDPDPIFYDETPDSSQQPLRNCSKGGGPFGGLYCRQFTCEWCRRNYTDEVCTLCCYEVEKSFVNDSNPNSFNASQNLSDYPPQPQYQMNSCELCGNDAHYGYDCPPQVLEELAEYINSLSWNCPAFSDDDDEYTIQYREYLENSSNAITPDLPTEEPDNSLTMGDEHLSTISETESDEVIKSSVEDLVLIPSESEGISNDTDDDSFENIDYVEASPPNSELVSLEEVNDDILREKLLNINLFIAKIESLNDNPTPDCVLKSPSSFLIPVKDNDTFFEKGPYLLSYSDNSLPEFETFSDHTEETSTGSTITHLDNSLPEYDSFLFEIEPDQ
ncbi:hypothetical protein Tco_0601907 [Tanacetum coccineum]